MAAEKFHGWTISHYPQGKIQKGRYEVYAEGPKPGDYVVTRSANIDDDVDAETLAIRTKVLVALKEYERADKSSKDQWYARLLKANEANLDNHYQRRLKRASLGVPNAEEHTANLVTGVVRTRGE